MITIVDYGMGNSGSVANMIRRMGGASSISSDPSEIARATKLVVPGVGAFDNGMEALGRNGLSEAVAESVAKRGAPILGICLGMQLLCKSSQEGKLPGLGWIDAEVIRFQPRSSDCKVPHMGWNSVKVVRSNPLIDMGGSEQRFYFVHSYRVVCNNQQDVMATTNYEIDFVSAFHRGNIYGVQFHPEKSHRFGMSLIKNFIEL